MRRRLLLMRSRCTEAVQRDVWVCRPISSYAAESSLGVVTTSEGICTWMMLFFTA